MTLNFPSFFVAWSGFWQDPAPLLNLLLRSSILLALALAFGRFANAARPEARILVYRAALSCTLGLMLLTLAPSFTPDVSRWNFALYSSPSSTEAKPETVAPSTTETPARTQVAPKVLPANPVAVAAVSRAQNSDSSAIPQKMKAAPMSLGEATPRDNKIENTLNFLLSIWPLVSAWLLFRLAWCHGKIVWMRRRAHPISDAQTLEILRGSCAAIGVKTPGLLRNSRAGAPSLCGVWRPAIVLPHDFAARFDSAALRAIFLHEAAHIRGRDCAWTYARRITGALLWPQPLLWILSKAMETAGEEACDLAVLEGGTAPRDYARCLLDLAEFLCLNPAQRALGAGVIPARSTLAHRVEQILKGVPKSRHLSGRARWAMAVVALGLGAASVAVAVDANTPLGAAGEISGRVVYKDGKPAAGLGIEVDIQESSSARITRNGSTQMSRRARQMLSRSAQTGADGTYRVKNLLAGATFNVMINSGISSVDQAGPPGFVGAAQAITPQRDKNTRVKDIVLTRGAFIEVRVEDAISGLPLGNMGVGCHGPNRPNSTGFIAQSFTDIKGRAVLRVPPGRSWVYWNGPVTSRRVEVHPGRNTPYEKGLEIVTNGTTTYGKTDFVEVRVDGKSSGYTRSGNGGMRDADAIDLEEGQTRRMTFRLAPLHIKERPGKLPLVRMSEVPPAIGTKPVAWNPDLVLPRTATGIIEGRAFLPNGTPFKNATLQIEMDNPSVERFADATLDYERLKKLPLAQQKMISQELKIKADGTYRVEGLTSAHYDITLSESDAPTAANANWLALPINGVSVRENQIVRAPDLIATRGGVILGRVIDAKSGQGLPQVFIPVYDGRSGSSRLAHLFDADKNGRFTARVLPGKVNLSLNFYNVSISKNVRLAGQNYDYRRARIYLDGKLQKTGISAEVLIREGQTRALEFRLPRVP